MNYASIQNCPDLDLSSSMDSLQTHDSLVTPESPRYSPSPHDSLEEGTKHTAHVTQVSNRQDITQVGTDSLAYDSLITTLSWLSLEPGLDPLSDPIMTHSPFTLTLDPYQITQIDITHKSEP